MSIATRLRKRRRELRDERYEEVRELQGQVQQARIRRPGGAAEAKGVPGAVIGSIARSKGAAPGQSNFHAAKGASKVPGKKPIDPKTLGSMKQSLNFK